MSTSDYSKMQRSAMYSVQAGRLIDAGDYDGAIAACTEAIALNSNNAGAYRTRAEAYRRLGREYEANADVRYSDGLGLAPGRQNLWTQVSDLAQRHQPDWFRTVVRLVGNELAIGIILVASGVASAVVTGTIATTTYQFWGGHGSAFVAPWLGLLMGAYFIIKASIRKR